MVDSLLNVIIIAKRNTSLRFVRALQSILSQIYTPIKVLVIDANEPDSVYSLGLQEDLVAFPEVGYLRLGQELSAAAIRNHVLQYAEGDYIAYLSSNDLWDQTKALLQLDQLKENPEAAASCSNGILIDERKAGAAVDPLIENLAFDPARWLLDNPARMSAQVIYRTEAIRKTGGFDEQFVNFCDGDMLLRLSKEHKILLLPVSLCECYLTPDQADYEWYSFRDSQKILYKYMEYFLLNKRMAQEFYVRMLHLARMNYLWLNYLLYLFMYLIKAPGHSALILLKKIGRIFTYIFKWNRRELSLLKEGIRISHDLYLLRRGRSDRIKALKPAARKERSGGEAVVFSSARQYNEANALDFVFDHKLKSIVIPEHITVIKKGMFYGCDQLVRVELPNTVLEIQAHAFHRCNNLREVIIQEGSRLGKIGEYAFAGCGSLEILSLPSSVIQIGKGAFTECRSLKQLLFTYMHHGEERIGKVYPTAIGKLLRYTFAGCINLQSVEFGANSMLETVEPGAFLGCSRLQKAVLTGEVKSLGSYSFAYCSELETIAIPQVDMLKSIGKGAFMHCRALDYFLFPNQIERIHVRTFYGCSGLKQVKIPKKVRSINHQAFAKCPSLVNTIILSGDVSISPTAFDKHTQVQIRENENKETPPSR